MTDPLEGRPRPASPADPAPAGGPGADRGLEVIAWTVARCASGGALVEIPAGVNADTEFADGTVSGSAGCNRTARMVSNGRQAVTSLEAGSAITLELHDAGGVQECRRSRHRRS